MPQKKECKPRIGRILVIDDDQPITELLHDALSADGHEVEIALSAERGIEMATTSDFDLVLTDLSMPGMSGWEVAGRIQSEAPGLPVVLVTGSTISEQQIRSSGVAAVVLKPFKIKELLATISTELRQRARPARSGKGEGGAVS